MEQGRDWAQEDAELRAEAIRAMMSHKATRKFLIWLLQVGKAIGHNPYGNDPLTTAMECGQMAVGQQVMSEIITADPEAFMRLLLELHNERTERNG